MIKKYCGHCGGHFKKAEVTEQQEDTSTGFFNDLTENVDQMYLRLKEDPRVEKNTSMSRHVTFKKFFDTLVDFRQHLNRIYDDMIKFYEKQNNTGETPYNMCFHLSLTKHIAEKMREMLQDYKDLFPKDPNGLRSDAIALRDIIIEIRNFTNNYTLC